MPEELYGSACVCGTIAIDAYNFVNIARQEETQRTFSHANPGRTRVRSQPRFGCHLLTSVWENHTAGDEL